MTAAEFAFLCKRAGLTAAEIDEWNIGTIIDFIEIRNESIRNENSDSAYTERERFDALKQAEPKIDELYRAGRIPEDKYRAFKTQLSEAE